MNSQEFVKEGINRMADKFPYAQYRYEFDAFSDCHYIEILPRELFKNEQSLILYRASFVNDFIEKYPCECLTFITEGNLMKIENPCYVKQGLFYSLKQESLRWNFADIDLFDTHAVDFHLTLKMEHKVQPLICSDHGINNIDMIGFHSVETLALLEGLTVKKQSNFFEEKTEAKGELNCALAA